MFGFICLLHKITFRQEVFKTINHLRHKPSNNRYRTTHGQGYEVNIHNLNLSNKDKAYKMNMNIYLTDTHLLDVEKKREGA